MNGGGGAGGTGTAGTGFSPFATCPMGECDNSMFFADTPCTSVYTAPVGPASSYCKAAETDSYCIQVGSNFGPDFSVTCVNGTAVVMKCTNGCGNADQGVGYACNSF